MCYLYISQIAKAESPSCAISNHTVQPVEDCPRTAEEWRKAAAKKNCSAYAHLCDRPGQFVYHCVINPYINETLEVCACSQKIVFGKKDFLDLN